MASGKNVFTRARGIACGFVLAGLVLGIAAWSGRAHAAINQWSQIPIDGGSVSQIIFAPGSASKLYLVAGYGVYRSIDSGASWQLLGEPCYGRCRIAPDPTNADRILVSIVGNRLYSSLNGATLAPVESLPPYQADAVQFSANGAVLYVTSGANFYRSTNGGTSWEARTAMSSATVGHYANQILVDPADAQTVIVHRTDGLLYVTRDGGGTWQSVSPPTNTHLSGLAFSQTGPQRLWAATVAGLFISSDLGANWSPTGLIGNTPAVATHPTDPRILYASTYSSTTSVLTLLRSTNEAASWQTVTTNPRAAGYSIAISTASTQSIATGGEFGAWLSPDGGVTGRRSISGLRGMWIQSMAAAAASDRVYLMNQYEIYRLDGSTGSVTGLGDALLAAFPGQSFSLRTGLAQSLNPDRLIVATGTGVIRSLDAGATWNAVWLVPSPESLADSPVSEDTLIAGSMAGIHRSTDGGATWTVAQGLPPQPMVFKVSMGATRAYASVVTSQPPTYTNTGHGVYRSTDNGATWVPANTGIETALVQAMALDPLNDQRLYAVLPDAIFRTLDAGATWNAVSWPRFIPTGGNLISLDPVNPSILYAANGNSVDRSIDDGTTWEQLRSNSYPPKQPTSILVDPVRPNTVLVSSYNGGAEQITIAPDLSLEASSSSTTVQPGARVTRRFTLRNLGPFHSTHPRVSFTVPATATDLAVTASGATASCTQAVPAFSCSLESLRAGFSVLFDVAFTQPAAGTFVLSASVAADQTDSAAANNTVQSGLLVEVHSDLTATIAGPATATEGDAITYTLTVNNAGPGEAANTQVSWPLPSGFTASTATASAGSCTISSSSVSCSLGALQPSASATVRLEATAPAAGTYQHVATVSAAVTDPNGTNNAPTVLTTVAARPAPPPPPAPTPEPPPTTTPPPPPAPAPTPTPPTSGGGGGGGGSMSLLLVFGLIGARLLRRRVLPI